jgi:hypothetical protein
MEAIINKKDEVICKLSEEIQYIKTKWSSLERGEAQNDLANKGRGLINASNEIPNNSKNKDLSQDNNLFNPRADGAKRRARVLIPPGYLHPGKGKH